VDPTRLTLIAVMGEGALAGAALLWAWARGIDIRWGPPASSTAAGVTAAAVLAVVNLFLLRRGPDVPFVRAMRRLHDELLEPLFARVRVADVLIVSAAAGLGEELLFRGVLQREWGVAAASVLFGLAHVGGSGTGWFGAWAAVVGAFLGWLAIASGGLLAPVVAHAAYDAMALAYVRWADGGTQAIDDRHITDGG
jgi:membrane protease YdiL (CAAX protease family)